MYGDYGCVKVIVKVIAMFSEICEQSTLIKNENLCRKKSLSLFLRRKRESKKRQGLERQLVHEQQQTVICNL